MPTPCEWCLSVVKPWLLYLQGKVVSHLLQLSQRWSIRLCQGNLLQGSILLIACTLTVCAHNLCHHQTCLTTGKQKQLIYRCSNKSSLIPVILVWMNTCWKQQQQAYKLASKRYGTSSSVFDCAKIASQVLTFRGVIDLVVLVWSVSKLSCQYTQSHICNGAPWLAILNHSINQSHECAHLAILDPVHTKLALL